MEGTKIEVIILVIVVGTDSKFICLMYFSPRYLYQDKGLKMPLEKITQVREEKRRVKVLENRLKEEERARRAEITRRREINKKREEENAKRGEIVQVVSNEIVIVVKGMI